MGLLTARLARGAPWVMGRSHCDTCKAPLPPRALVPILSWAFARGRCVLCNAAVSPASTITEIILGVLFVLAYLLLGLTEMLPAVLIALALLAGLVIYDLAHGLLPAALLGLFVAAACFAAITASATLEILLVTLCTALLIGSSLAVVHLASRGRAMGLADAPLAFGLALIAGPSALSGFVLTFWMGGVVGIILLALRARGVTIQSEVPFAPYLAAGFLLAYFTRWDILALVSLALSGA